MFMRELIRKILREEVSISEAGIDPQGRLVGVTSPEDDIIIERMKELFHEAAIQFLEMGYYEDPLDGLTKIDDVKAIKSIKVAYEDYFGNKLKDKGYGNLSQKYVNFMDKEDMMREWLLSYIESVYSTWEGYEGLNEQGGPVFGPDKNKNRSKKSHSNVVKVKDLPPEIRDFVKRNNLKGDIRSVYNGFTKDTTRYIYVSKIGERIIDMRDIEVYNTNKDKIQYCVDLYRDMEMVSQNSDQSPPKYCHSIMRLQDIINYR